jgi:hypothetical protein
MSRIALRFGVLVALLLTSAPRLLHAEDVLPQRQAEPDLTSYQFEDDLVKGGGVQPGLEVLHARRRSSRESLIRVREHFVRELLISAERL